ncbi:MAG: MASE3 domain-containing protein [Clostridia bacterium]
MAEININTNQNVNTLKSFSLKYLFILIISYIIAFFATPTLWQQNMYVMHTIIELICIHIAISTFLIIWNTFNESFNEYHLIGFGFLAIAVFDSFHTYYWFAVKYFAQGYPDLPHRYWIIGRLTEAFVLFVFSLKHGKFRMNKWTGLFFVLAFSFGLSIVLLIFPGLMPIMLTKNGLSPMKIALEYVVIALTILSLYSIKDKLRDETSISYKHVFMALLFIIPAELSFTMYKVITSFYNVYGHILKLVCYYFLYKAVYVSCVVYPYKKLAEAYDKLEETYKKINKMDETLNDTLRNGKLVYLNEVKKEQEMRNFHLQTQTILNAVSNCVLMTDKDKRIILSNEAFNKVFEINDIEIIGMHLNKFNEIIDFRAFDLSEFLVKGEEFDHPREVSITSLKGNRRELLVYVTPIRDVESEVIGAISVFTDITEMKKQHHNMQQQEKLALIGQMTAGIVHEIKNPLATIKGLSQLIKLKANTDKVREYSNVINSAIDDLTKVVNEFLSFAKPNPAFKVRTNLNRIVESMKLITETQCYTKNIKSQFQYSSYPIEITADEIKIKQVILNITENAIAAMEGVELPELIVSTYYAADSGEGVIKITDNGIGMCADVLNKIGTPFFTTKEKGTGLGLGISYQIISEHNGRIEVESTEGKGTTFKIIFSQIENLI